MKLIYRAAITWVIAAGSTSVAFAENEPDLRYSHDTVTATVNFADLDLANPVDAQTLLDRIYVTARKVCQRANPPTSLPSLPDRRRCFTENYHSGVALINSRRDIDIEAVAARTTASREVVEAD